ncbi:enoyl-CoA delta isomerase 3, peroxisomal-like [Ostrinia nubilalis]|uniref:enoyl-CoA delta isomerase 3, peroxisomal-like n=1 Tax=Ostrinia nubilalis TaxID=29057 RepID=UPI003082360D
MNNLTQSLPPPPPPPPSSGNDLTAAFNYEGVYDLYPVLRDFIRAFIEFPKMLVAIVNGPAIGIAATTLPLCDLVFASENSYFYTPFTKLGIVAEGCSSFTFSRIMGERKALEMLLFNYKMPAIEALQCGFVNELYKPEELQHKVWDKIIEVTNMKRESLIESKKLIRGQIKDHLLEINDKECK